MNNKISLNIIDGAKSRRIIHSFALKLKELLIRKETEITFYVEETRESFYYDYIQIIKSIIENEK